MERLEAAYEVAPWEEWVRRDPLWYVRQYPEARDQEIVGMIAAALAYGRVGSIMPAVEKVLAAMDRQPYLFVTHFHPERDAARFHGFAHRFHTADAITAMLHAMQMGIERHGSLGEMFLHGHRPRAEDTTEGLARFVETLRGFTEAAHGPWMNQKALYGWRHFLASPADGSACKRLNLYLRWMVRAGVPDVGAWPGISPRQLLIPVDTHVAHIARRMRWTQRAAADLAMAQQITAALRRVDKEDPIRFDFVLSHLGMDGLAGKLAPVTHPSKPGRKRPV